jgi:tetratricopeptide (TPR) repeat protein
MKDLSSTLDDRLRERLERALQDLDETAFGVVAEDIMESIGVHISSLHHEGRTVVMEGTGEAGAFLIYAGRDRSLATIERVRELAARAADNGKQAVLLTTTTIPKAVEDIADKEGVSVADQERTLLLMRKYGQADRLLADVDRRVLEQDGPRSLPSAGRVDLALQDAGNAYARGDYEQVLHLTSQALDMKGGSDRAWELRANALYQMRRYEEASYSCRRAMESRPSDGALHFLLALIYEDDGRLDDALSEYDLALKATTGMAAALLNKGAVLYRQGRYEWASKVYEQMIRYHPQDARGHNNLGKCLLALGKAREARVSFNKAVALDASYPDPLLNLASMETDPRKGAEAWKKVVTVAPGLQKGWSMWGLFAAAAGNEDDAVRALHKALELDPLDREAKGALLELRGETALAVNGEHSPVPAPQEQMPVVVENVSKPAVVTPSSPPAVVEQASMPALPEEGRPPMLREEAPSPLVVQRPPSPVVPEKAALPVVREEPAPPTEKSEEDEMVPLVAPAQGAVGIAAELVPEVAVPEVVDEVPEESAIDALAEAIAAKRADSVEGEMVGRPLPVPEEPLQAKGEDVGMGTVVLAQEALEVQEQAAPGLDAAVEEEAFPDDPFEGARALLSVGRYQQALDRLLGMEGALIDRLRSTIFYRMGRLAESRDALVKAMALGRNERDLLDAEALSYAFGNGDACLELLAALEPSKEEKAREVAVLLELNRLGEIVARAPNFGEETSYLSRKALASALMLRGRYRDAQKVLRALLEERSMDAEALNSMGICMRHMGEYGYEEPAKLFRAAIALDPTYADAWNNLGCTFFATTNYAEAVKAIGQAASLQRRPEFLVNLATCQLVLADIEGAKMSLTTAMKLEETPDVLFALALIAEKEGDLRWAVRLYDDALAKAPGYRQAQANRDRALILLRNEKKR